MAFVNVTIRDMQDRETERLEAPGYSYPIHYLPHRDQRHDHAIADFVNRVGVTVRELRMLDFVNQITDKPDWDKKVTDLQIVAKWKEEANRTIDVNGKDDVILSDEMFEFVSSGSA